LRRIGRGAFGEVWLARSALGTYRAVKIVYRATFEDSRPFEREFAGLQKFEPISRSHAGLVQILQVGKREDYFYAVMELADGVENPKAELEDPKQSLGTKSEKIVKNGGKKTAASEPVDATSYVPRTLREDLHRGRLPATRCVEDGLALASALEHLHKQGLIHRDVKPSNIIFVQGAPKLADIGLVTDASDSKSIRGTDGYIAPEGTSTPQADIFSFGKTLYEMVTGQDRLQFPDLPAELKNWPDKGAVLEVNEIAVKACQRDTGLRYRSAEELCEELQLLRSGRSVKRRRVLQHWWILGRRAALIGSAMALIAAAAILALRPSYRLSKVPRANILIEEGNSYVSGNLNEDGISNAVWCFAQATELDSNSVPAYFGLWWASTRWDMAHGTNDFPTRGALANKLAKLAPRCAEPLIASAESEWGNWHFSEGLRLARLATQRRANSKEAESGAHFYYGDYLLRTGGSAKEAMAHFQKAYKLDPSNPKAYEHFGDVYAVNGNFDEALKQYEHCRTPGRHFLVLEKEGLLYEAMTNFTKAINAFRAFEKQTGHLDKESEASYSLLEQAARQADSSGNPKLYWDARLRDALKQTEGNEYYTAASYMWAGDRRNAYLWLTNAFTNHDRLLDSQLLTEHCWDHNDPQFKAFAKWIGLTAPEHKSTSH
jgi:serine/threonine protein kinase